jgi:nitrate reductase NapE component
MKYMATDRKMITARANLLGDENWWKEIPDYQIEKVFTYKRFDMASSINDCIPTLFLCIAFCAWVPFSVTLTGIAGIGFMAWMDRYRIIRESKPIKLKSWEASFVLTRPTSWITPLFCITVWAFSLWQLNVDRLYPINSDYFVLDLGIAIFMSVVGIIYTS